MANTKISALTELTGADVDIAADFLAIVDTGVTTTKKIIPSNLLGAAFTTAGDILQASGDGVAARLGIGTARQVPTVNSGATALAYANPITLATVQASTSGTSIDFTSVPAGVRRVTVLIDGVSTSGTSVMIVQIGDSGGIEATSYVGSAWGALNGNPELIINPTTGFGVAPDGGAGYLRYGIVVLHLITGSTWVASGGGGQSDSARQWGCGGSKALSAALDRVRITTVGGTDTFDAGQINISYE